MVSTSAMCGTLDSTVRPSARRQRHHQLERRILRSACADGAPRAARSGSTTIWSTNPSIAAGGRPRPGSRRSADQLWSSRGDDTPSPGPEPRHGPGADDRGRGHGGQPLDGPRRQAGRRRRRRRGDADRALDRADGRDRRDRRGREGQCAHALQRGEDRRRDAPADRHRRGPHRRHDADRPGPRRCPGRDRRRRAGRHVRPRALRLHGEAGRRPPGQGGL